MDLRVYLVGAPAAGLRSLVDSLRSMMHEEGEENGGNPTNDLFHTLNGNVIEQRVLSELPPSPEQSSSSSDDDADDECDLDEGDEISSDPHLEAQEEQHQLKLQQNNTTGDSIITVDPIVGAREAPFCPTIASKTKYCTAFLQSYLQPRDIGFRHSFLGALDAATFDPEDFHMILSSNENSSPRQRHQQQQQQQKTAVVVSRVASAAPRDETTLFVSGAASSSTTTVRRCRCEMTVSVPPQLLLSLSDILPRGAAVKKPQQQQQQFRVGGPPPKQTISVSFNEVHTFSQNCLAPQKPVLADAHVVLVVADAARWIVRTAKLATDAARDRGAPLGPALFEDCLRQSFITMTETGDDNATTEFAAGKNGARRCVLVLTKWDICLSAAAMWKQKQQQQQTQQSPVTGKIETLYSSSDREEAVSMDLFLEVASFFSHAVPQIYLMSVRGSHAQFSDLAVVSSRTGSNIKSLAESLRTWAVEAALQLEEDRLRRRAAIEAGQSGAAASGDDKKCLIA